MAKKIRLSQCMIVKNEEKNIERALTWGKDIVCEQIVVDTGSTDRTVEIAEKMGAKVYHFEWINDFSAAKNFAIEQASGEWIAFLDADEYFEPKAVAQLLPLLFVLEKKENAHINLVRTPIYHLDDRGKIFSSGVQDRVFRNVPWIRYQNAVHEVLYSNNPKHPLYAYSTSDDFAIFHTGYAGRVYQEKQKGKRNIELLLKELERDPNNGDVWSYLGDSYQVDHQMEKAREAWEKAISFTNSRIRQDRKMIAVSLLMNHYLMKVHGAVISKTSGRKIPEIEDLYQRFQNETSETADMYYFMGTYYWTIEEYVQAIYCLQQCIAVLEENKSISNYICTSKLYEIYRMLADSYSCSNQKAEAVRYCTASLKANRFQNDTLHLLLNLFLEAKEQNSAVYGFLEKLYDFQDPKDAYCVAKAAKQVGNIALAELALSKLPQTESHWSRALEQTRTLWAHEADRFPALQCQNGIDLEVSRILGYLQEHTADEIREHILQCYTTMQEKHPEQAEKYTALYDKVSYWGKLEPDFWEIGARENCANYLKEQWADILWLYGRLGDYRSKEVLHAILRNWLELDFTQSMEVKQNGKKYYDLDLMPAYQNGTAVDVGAYIGNTVKSFVRTYGEAYEKIYCYEPDTENVQRLEMKLTGLQNLCIRSVGVGKKSGSAVCNHDTKFPNMSTLEVLESGELRADMVPVVTLDEDIPEDITYLKINVCGMEEDVLIGAEKQIKKNHPFIAVDAFYGYEALTALARRIDAICPGYTFYLRHFGENLVMTDFVLYAVYQKN